MDFGSKRIGLAVGESGFGVASPKPPLAASGTLAADAQAIAAEAARCGAEAIVLGLPLSEDGSHTRMARVCLQLADRLRELGWEVHLADERLTSVEAERAMRDVGLKGAETRRRKDGEAAARILERFFAEGGGAG